jgi:hypothetical protein
MREREMERERERERERKEARDCKAEGGIQVGSLLSPFYDDGRFEICFVIYPGFLPFFHFYA